MTVQRTKFCRWRKSHAKHCRLQRCCFPFFRIFCRGSSFLLSSPKAILVPNSSGTQHLLARRQVGVASLSCESIVYRGRTPSQTARWSLASPSPHARTIPSRHSAPISPSPVSPKEIQSMASNPANLNLQFAEPPRASCPSSGPQPADHERAARLACGADRRETG
jgi:hypothetical protein